MTSMRHWKDIYVFELSRNLRNLICCNTTASDEAILQNICSWGVWSPRKSYMFLQNFEKALLKYLICSYGISFSWKILCVLTKFWTRSPGNFDLFLWYFFLLENRTCTCGILRILSWKVYMCSYTIFGSPKKFDVF